MFTKLLSEKFVISRNRVSILWKCDLKKELEENEEMRHYFEEYDLVDPLQPCDVFFGGCTNAARLFHQCEGEEKIRLEKVALCFLFFSTKNVFFRYVDFTSLYPWCNKSTRMVVGHPEIITENFQDISTYFCLIKCTVSPPRGLFHPVLPYRTPSKLTFPLCKACVDTASKTMWPSIWSTRELH